MYTKKVAHQYGCAPIRLYHLTNTVPIICTKLKTTMQCLNHHKGQLNQMNLCHRRKSLENRWASLFDRYNKV